jgi:hypothetical protein
MTDFNQDQLATPRRRLRLDGRPAKALAAILLLGLGAAGGAGAVSMTRPGVEMAPAQPVAIASLSTRTGIVTVRGRVAEVYGSRFTIQDGTGRTLIDAGPRALDGSVTTGAQVTVQGRVDEGVLHASFLVGADGNVTSLGPPHGGPRHGPGPRGDGPPQAGCGPEGAPPPPPPPAQGNAQTPAAAAAPAPAPATGG